MRNIFYRFLYADNKFKLEILDENKNKINKYDTLEKNELNDYIKSLMNNEFNISWDFSEKLENISNEIIVEEELLNLLLKNENFVDENLKRIIVKEVDNINLIVRENLDNPDEVLINLEVDEQDFYLENVIDDYLYSKGIFYKTSILSNEFYKLEDLFVKIQKYELESFLTLVLKNYKDINIKYEDYHIVEGTKKEAVPQIIIEKISLDNSLYLRINLIISTMDYDFFLKNQIEKIITINELEKKVHISQINTESLSENIEEIVKVLMRLQKKIKPKFTLLLVLGITDRREQYGYKTSIK